MNKIAAETVANILGQVGPALRAQQEKIASLEGKVAFYEKRERVTKLASEMEAKNLDPETPFSDKVEKLMQTPDDQVEVVEKAVGLSAQQVKLAALSDFPGNPSDAVTAFEAGVIGRD